MTHVAYLKAYVALSVGLPPRHQKAGGSDLRVRRCGRRAAAVGADLGKREEGVTHRCRGEPLNIGR